MNYPPSKYLASFNHKIIRGILYLLLFIGFSSLQAQTNNLHQYTIDEGLASNSVYGTMQDREGYIWIFTEDGISKFDGYTFKNFYEGLPRYDVWDLKEDSKGRLWVHTVHNRLVYIYQDSIHEVKNSGDYKFYMQNFFEREGDIWSQGKYVHEKTGAKVFSIQNDTVVFHPWLPRDQSVDAESKRLFSKKANYIGGFQTGPEEFSLLKKDSLFYLNEKWEITGQRAADTDFLENRTSHGPTLNTNISIIEYGALYRIIDKLQILKWDINHFEGAIKNFQTIYDDPIDPFYSILCKGDSTLQLSLMPQPGFLELDLDLNMLDTFSVKGLNIRRIFKDRRGNYWIATSGDGIYFATAASRNAKNVISYDVGRISKLIGDNEGGLYISTESDGVYRFSDNKAKQILPYAEIGGYAKGLAISKNGTLYAAGDQGIFNLGSNAPSSAQSVKPLLCSDYDWIKPIRGSRFKNVKTLALNEEFGEKRLWYSSDLIVQYIEIGEETKPKTTYFKLIEIESIITDQKGQVWAGGKDGLWIFENNDFVKRRYNHEALSRTISDMEIDENNILWCSVEGYEVGVVGLKSDTLYSIAGTANFKVNDLYTDKEGFLWVATTQGLLQYEIDPNNFTDQKLIRKYTTSDGINTREVTAVYVDSQYVYAGTNKGLTQIDRQGKYGDNSKPTLYVKDVRVNGKSQHLSNDYKFPSLQNDLEIDFVALSYKSLGDISYSYQLVGVDDKWQETRNKTLYYPNLSPGEYSFFLKARDIDNNEVELASPIHFFIKTPIWDRTWFRLLIAASIGGILWLIYKNSINTIRRKEEEKTRVAKQIAELEMKALQSQMNPHFVFNALASIRYYIQNNKADQAGDYLARFAKLMRLFLESSKSNFTSLEDEIKLISLYVEMEQLRFEEQFDFQLEVGEDVDVYFVQIPTLLLQPFVENAINHGLFHKDEKGTLKVEFHLREEELLECTIEDDGIGQAAAKAIGEKSSKGHKSRAMQIVGERLEVLKYKDDMDIEIEVIDLEDGGVAAGTRVVIRIPLSF